MCKGCDAPIQWLMANVSSERLGNEDKVPCQRALLTAELRFEQGTSGVEVHGPIHSAISAPLAFILTFTDFFLSSLYVPYVPLHFSLLAIPYFQPSSFSYLDRYSWFSLYSMLFLVQSMYDPSRQQGSLHPIPKCKFHSTSTCLPPTSLTSLSTENGVTGDLWVPDIYLSNPLQVTL